MSIAGRRLSPIGVWGLATDRHECKRGFNALARWLRRVSVSDFALKVTFRIPSGFAGSTRQVRVPVSGMQVWHQFRDLVSTTNYLQFLGMTSVYVCV